MQITPSVLGPLNCMMYNLVKLMTIKLSSAHLSACPTFYPSPPIDFANIVMLPACSLCDTLTPVKIRSDGRLKSVMKAKKADGEAGLPMRIPKLDGNQSNCLPPVRTAYFILL